MTFHDPVEPPTRSLGVILGSHHHHRSDMLIVAPLREHLTLISGSIDFGDVLDIRYAERRQVANLPCPSVLVGKPSADELVVFSARRIIKNRDSLRDAALHEIRRFERPRAAGIKR